MEAIRRLNALKYIAREIEKKYSLLEINFFLKHFKFPEITETMSDVHKYELYGIPADYSPKDEKNIVSVLGGLKDYQLIEFLKEIELLDAYFDYFDKGEENDEQVYEGVDGMSQYSKILDDVLWLSYTDSRELLLNDVILITRTRYNSINDRLLRYLFQHPGRRIERKEFEEQGVLSVEKKEDKDFYVFLDDIKIKADLRKLFFSKDLSKHSLHLTNRISENDMKNHDIKFIDIKQIFKV